MERAGEGVMERPELAETPVFEHWFEWTHTCPNASARVRRTGLPDAPRSAGDPIDTSVHTSARVPPPWSRCAAQSSATAGSTQCQALNAASRLARSGSEQSSNRSTTIRPRPPSFDAASFDAASFDAATSASSRAGSTTVTSSPRSTNGRVAIPVPAPISTATSPGPNPASRTRTSNTASGCAVDTGRNRAPVRRIVPTPAAPLATLRARPSMAHGYQGSAGLGRARQGSAGLGRLGGLGRTRQDSAGPGIGRAVRGPVETGTGS